MSTAVAGSAMTQGQERLWFLDQMDPGDPSYTVPLVLRLTGELSAEALRAAFDGVIARHETLRTRFPDEDGRPIAVVEPPAAFPLEVVDLRERPQELHAELVARTNRGFDLARGPLLRAALLRQADTEYVLCVTLHHIVADGWSLTLLREELAQRYAAHRAGQPVDLPAPLSYTAHAAAERARADGPGAREALAYWQKQLAGAPALELPLERPRPEAPSARGAFHTRIIAGAVPAVEELARTRRCTPFMVLLSAYQAVLHRSTGQEDFCVGVPAAGRDTPETEQVIGYFSSTLVLRADLGGAPAFGDLLRRARRTVLGAFGHAQVPFERLAEALDLARDPGRTPLFQTLLTVHTHDGGMLRDAPFADLSCTETDPCLQAVKFDLSLDIRYDGDDLVAVFGYRTDLLDADWAARLGRRFETLLRGVLAEPDTPVHRIPLLDAQERRQLAAWGRGPECPALPGRSQTVLAAVEHAARTRPGGTAVRGPGDSLDYTTLWAEAGRLAARLAAAGVRHGDTVGILLPRGPRTVVALLAAWRAGAAYLPLDPEYPAARLAFMVADSGTRVVVTADGEQTDGENLLPEGVRTLAAGHGGARENGEREDGAGDSAAPGALPAAGADDPAYLVYTSGSTGTPKGVLVPHRALAARVAWMLDGYGLTAADRVLQSASLSFDTCAEEIFPALAAGATLVVPDPASTLPDQLTEDLADGLTVLDLPTPYWHQLVADLDAVAWPDTLRLLILGADQVRPGAVAAWRARFGDRVRIVNSYGPTETAIIATAADLGAGDAVSRPPIGTPLGGVTAAVCDPHGGLVPPGTPGELLLGGTGVTCGYTGRPGATARAFVPDPDGPPGARRYRTGDLVRWRSDGRLEFLGRLDSQVKVRGYRVEPGEVETALLALPGVGQAAVLARGDALAGFVVPAADPPADTPAGTAEDTVPVPADLRAALAATLPAHLVPNTVAVLDALPLTPNGKLDVRALPALDQRPELRAAYLEPRSEAEELVVDIWREVLGLDRVGVLDDFFDLGGHSLLATRVIARIRSTARLTVPLRTLFTRRTAAAFAEAVEAALIAEIDALSEDEAKSLLEGTASPS